MEYRDFVEQVKEQIQDFLPEKFADAAVEVNQIVKNNDCVLDGLMVRTEESNIARMLADGSRGRVSVKEKLAEMKQKISDQKMPEKPETVKSKGKEESL